MEIAHSYKPHSVNEYIKVCIVIITSCNLGGPTYASFGVRDKLTNCMVQGILSKL